MSQKVSQALIKMLNELTNIETTLSKVKAAIFVKKCENLMQEKISYLYNLLHQESKQYKQSSESQNAFIESIIKIYTDKLNIIYDELYLQYVNIQNEIGDARLNQKVAMINFQKIVNDSEVSSKDYNSLKEKLRNKNEIYEKIIKKCEEQFNICISDFESQIDNTFFIETSLKVSNETGIFSKIKNALKSMFKGKSLYKNALENYKEKIEKIDTGKIISDFRNQTIEFVTDILEIKDIYLEKAV